MVPELANAFQNRNLEGCYVNWARRCWYLDKGDCNFGGGGGCGCGFRFCRRSSGSFDSVEDDVGVKDDILERLERFSS